MDKKTIEWIAVCGRSTADKHPEVCKPKIPTHALKWIAGVSQQQELIAEKYGN